MAFPLLSIQQLSIDFTSGKQVIPAVKSISFQVNRGEILALVGESGSGKSVTSLSILQLLPSPPALFSSGEIFFSETGEKQESLLKASRQRMQEVRGNKIAMIFQEPMTSLNPLMRCGLQVMEPLQHHKKLSAAAAKKIAMEWLHKVQLPDPEKIFERYPHQLSGGQKQRVMIAMAMCCEPALLICDEPTTALDVTVQKTILQLIRDLQKEKNMGVIFITHDLGVVSEIADRVAILYKGEMVEQGQAKHIFGNPSHPYTKALIACRPSLHPKGIRLPVVADFLEGKETVKSMVNGPLPSTAKDELLRVEDLVVRFPARTNFLGKATSYFTAVDGVSFDIRKGETLGLVGESGCGKTTLGRTLLLLKEPASGKIIYNGRDITHLKSTETIELRKEVQLIFQDPYSSLNPRLTIGNAIEEPMMMKGTERKDRRKKMQELLDRVNLPSTAAGRYPHEFSGGQRQRIVIARALAMGPSFLVCDESVSALDVSVQAQVLNLLNELKKDLGLTMLFISHDLSVVRYMSDRIMVMQAGKIIEKGVAEEVYHHPQHPYTKMLLSAVPSLQTPA